MGTDREYPPGEEVAPHGFLVQTDNPGHLQRWNTICSLLMYKKIWNSFPSLKANTKTKTKSSPDWYNLISTPNAPVIHLSEQGNGPAFSKTFKMNRVKLSLQAVLMKTRLPMPRLVPALPGAATSSWQIAWYYLRDSTNDYSKLRLSKFKLLKCFLLQPLLTLGLSLLRNVVHSNGRQKAFRNASCEASGWDVPSVGTGGPCSQPTVLRT